MSLVEDEPAPIPPLVGQRVVVRDIVADDLEAIEAVMRSPGVRVWWWDFDVDDFSPHLREPGVTSLVIEHAHDVVGYIQYAEEESVQYYFAGIDIALRDESQGHGFGSDAIRTLARYLFDVRGHHRLTIDPALANERAIRCYERVGFRRVGVLRQYERGADGSWHDGLLMDLLAGELTEPHLHSRSHRRCAGRPTRRRQGRATR
jgi:aminoglycoside 6'-N-acetyltransferase